MGTPEAPSLLQKHLLLEKALNDPSLGQSRSPAAILSFIMRKDFLGRGVQITRAQIAAGTRLSAQNESAISKHIRRLENAGYICVDRRYDPRAQKNDTNRYRANYSPKVDCPPKQETAVKTAANMIRESLDCDWEPAHNAAKKILDSTQPPGSVQEVWRLIYDARNGADELKRLAEHHLKL